MYLPNNKSKTIFLPKNRIYLDRCSTYISFFNEELLEDICQIDMMLLGHKNSGTSKTNWVGNYGDVEAWFNISGIANIFSIPALKKLGYHIKYDSYDRYYLVTNRKTDVATKFIEDENGLIFVESTKEVVMFVQKIRNNYEGFTEKEVEKAVLGRKAPGLIGHPYAQDLKYPGEQQIGQLYCHNPRCG